MINDFCFSCSPLVKGDSPQNIPNPSSRLEWFFVRTVSDPLTYIGISFAGIAFIQWLCFSLPFSPSSN